MIPLGWYCKKENNRKCGDDRIRLASRMEEPTDAHHAIFWACAG